MKSNYQNFQDIDKLTKKQKDIAYQIGVNQNKARYDEKIDDDELEQQEAEAAKNEELQQKAIDEVEKESDKEKIAQIKNDIKNNLDQDPALKDEEIQQKAEVEAAKEIEKEQIKQAKEELLNKKTSDKKEVTTENKNIFDKLDDLIERF